MEPENSNLTPEIRKLKFTSQYNSNFSSLVEELDTGVIIHDSTTKIIYANRSASNLLGINRDKLNGLYAADPSWHFLREDKTIMPIEEYPVSRVCFTKLPIRNLIIGTMNQGAAKPKWVLCNANPEIDKMGNLTEIIINFNDITQEKLLKDELAELNILFKAALSQTQAGIVIADAPSGKLRYLNQAGFMMRGGKSNERIEDFDINKLFSLWKFMQIDGKSVTNDDLPLVWAMKNGKAISKELLLRQKNLEDRIVWSNASPVFRADGTIMASIAVFFDISERHEIEKNLLESKINAEKTALVKTRFIDVAAHELRTPVTAFSLLLQLTQKQLENGKAVDIKTLKKLRGQVDRISNLVVDLLDVSRLERGRVTLIKESKNIIDVINDCVEELKLRDPSRKIEFIKPKNPIIVDFDALRISQVISNLLENSRKYTPKDLPINVSIEIYPEFIRVKVKDMGPGISAQQQAELFTPFTRGIHEASNRSEGLGLGLYICSEIIKLHHGSIRVESQINQGSTFYFDLPIDKN